MSSKRKRLSLKEKLKIIQDSENEIPLKEISLKYGVPILQFVE